MNLDLYCACLIKLIKAAFSGGIPENLPKEINVDILIDAARRHSVANIIYEPLKNLGILGPEYEQKMKTLYNFAIRNDAVQSYYLDIITDAFEKNEIPHCVMKGPVIKTLYPRTDFRQSGDLDIFVPDKYREKAKNVMLGMGFEIERFNPADADDVYIIDKKTHVELHRILVSNKTPWQKECQKITERLVLKEDKQYTYEMTAEDYYLYMIAHMAKHMMYSGMGIKMLLDVWIYMEKKSKILDKNILKERLSHCGLEQFEENIRKLVDFWFNDGPADELIKKLGNYVFLSGTFGTKKQLDAYFYAKNAGKSNSPVIAKTIYYWKFFFMPYKWMCARYPILKKIPVILPFCWVHRALKTLIFEREKSQDIASRYDNVDLAESKKIQEFKREIGL